MDNASDLVHTNRLQQGILQIILYRTEALNVLNPSMLNQLNEIFLDAKDDVNVKALLITGAGKHFCAGADINNLVTLDIESGCAFSRHAQLIMSTLESLGKPSIAAINGYAFGAGCELAIAASLRIAEKNAVFALPEIKLGIIPGSGGTQRLSRLVGKGRAMEMCLTGKSINAEQALQWGLISEVTPKNDLIPRAIAILDQMVALPPFALRSIMKVVDHGFNLPLEEALALEAAYFGLCCSTNDKTEGVNAFIEKRPAVFKGN